MVLIGSFPHCHLTEGKKLVFKAKGKKKSHFAKI